MQKEKRKTALTLASISCVWYKICSYFFDEFGHTTLICLAHTCKKWKLANFVREITFRVNPYHLQDLQDALKYAPNIQKLEIIPRYGDLSKEHICFLQQFTSLQDLYVANCKKDLNLRSLVNCRVVQIQDCSSVIFPLSVEHIVLFPGCCFSDVLQEDLFFLKTLSIDRRIRRGSLMLLLSLSITTLQLRGCCLDDVSCLAQLTTLRKLEITEHFSSTPPILGIEKCTQLTHLSLEGKFVVLEDIAKLTNLQKLTIFENNNVQHDLRCLNGLQHLRKVTIDGVVTTNFLVY